MTLSIEDLVEGGDYYYSDISNITSRTFRITQLNLPERPLTHLRLLEVTGTGHFDPFSYTKDEFRRRFIPVMKPLDPNLAKLIRIISFTKNTKGFNDILNERLVALEV